MKTHLLPFLAALLFAVVLGADVHAGDLVLSAGTSSGLQAEFGEGGNRSFQSGVRYAGERFGVRLDHSAEGDDDGNDGVTADVYLRPFGGLVLAGGLGYFEKPLRTLGRQANFHTLAGWEFRDLLEGIGIGVYFDHWSNGRRLFNRDLPHNPPRNVLSVGLVIPL